MFHYLKSYMNTCLFIFQVTRWILTIYLVSISISFRLSAMLTVVNIMGLLILMRSQMWEMQF